MPFASQQQAKLMYGAAKNPGKYGIKASVARKFVADSQGQAVRNLPKRVSVRRSGRR